MSGSRQVSGGRVFGKSLPPEKSNFMHTCNLLSRYIKKKGSLRDFNLEIDGKIESLESIMKSGFARAGSTSSTGNLLTQEENLSRPSADSLPRPAGPDSTIDLLEETSKKDISSEEAKNIEPKTTQLTIFYAGKVLVFDDCPADKAKELVQFASKGNPHISGEIVSNILHQNTKPSSVAATMPTSGDGLAPKPSFQAGGCSLSNGLTDKESLEGVGYQRAGGISSNACKDILNNGSGVAWSSSGTEARIPLQPEANGSDLPIARRSSVHRFLEKRKERAAARGPYQVQEHQPSSSSSKGDEHLDLKL